MGGVVSGIVTSLSLRYIEHEQLNHPLVSSLIPLKDYSLEDQVPPRGYPLFISNSEAVPRDFNLEHRTTLAVWTIADLTHVE